MNETVKILRSIEASKPIKITDLLRNLGMDSIDLAAPVFRALRFFEETGLVNVIRPKNGGIASVELTKLGVERAREALTGQDRCPSCVADKAKRAERL